MKRSISPDFASEAKRFDQFLSPQSQFQQQHHNHNPQQQQQMQHIHQQQQIMAQQQQIQAVAAVAQAQQQQQQFQMQHQIQQQQQQQYASNPPFFNQQAFFPMNTVNMAPFPAPAPPQLMYNNSPSWNFMSTPPPFFNPTPSAASGAAQPPLPPPELKPEKPPLPKDPEPPLGHPKKNDFLIRPPGASPNYNNAPPGLRAPGSPGGLRIRGVNALNGAIYNGFNGVPGGIRGPPPIRQTLIPPNTGNNLNSPYTRNNRRRNPHHFPNMNPHPFFPRMDGMGGGHFGDYNNEMMAQFNEEEQPAGPEKLTIFLNDAAENGQVQVNKKAKRKPMSSRYSRSKEWVREDAEAALALEREYSKAAKRQMLILKFPDPDLNKYIVKKYSPFIETVHFQQPSTPRYCFVQLKEGADTAKVLETIREIPFGTGKIVAEPKTQPSEDHVVSPEEIDPYTLYIGNLPTSISVKAVKTHFPNAQRIDIGYAQRMRYTRYAFIRYNSVDEAMKAYKNTVNALLESRSLIVRFRRQKGNIGLPGETKINNPQRSEDRGEALMTTTRRAAKAWDPDADDDDYHDQDEDIFMLDEIEEDDDDIDLDEEALHSLEVRANTNRQLAFGGTLVDPKDEIDKDKNEEATSATKPTDEEMMKKKQKEGTKTSQDKASSQGSKQNPTKVTSKNNLQEEGDPTTTLQAIATNVNTTNSTSTADPVLAGQSLLEERLDTKDNVLDKANELLNTTVEAAAASDRPQSESPDCICTDPPETSKKILPETVKLENSGDESSSDIEGINLLGTRVKDEFCEVPERVPTPTMDDIYLDDYEYDNMDEEPEEEDDDWADTALSTRTTNWEELRRRELNAKEDKPDLDTLVKISDTLSSATAAAKVLPIVANLEPKSEFEKLYNARQMHNISDTIGETDDLHDMFAEMNSDLDEDDDNQF